MAIEKCYGRELSQEDDGGAEDDDGDDRCSRMVLKMMMVKMMSTMRVIDTADNEARSDLPMAPRSSCDLSKWFP